MDSSGGSLYSYKDISPFSRQNSRPFPHPSTDDLWPRSNPPTAAIQCDPYERRHECLVDMSGESVTFHHTWHSTRDDKLSVVCNAVSDPPPCRSSAAGLTTKIWREPSAIPGYVKNRERQRSCGQEHTHTHIFFWGGV